MLIRPAGLLACILVCAPLFAQTADECIQKYNALKGHFVAESGEAPVFCEQEGHVIALDAEGDVNALPLTCLGALGPERANHPGAEDHWHLKARAVLGPNPSCSVRLLGFTGQALQDYPGCGTADWSLDLPADEGAAWRNFLRGECPQAGEE